MASMTPFAISLGAYDYPAKITAAWAYIEGYLTNLESFSFAGGGASLGGAASAWGGLYVGLEVKAASMYAQASAANMVLTNNAYHNGSSAKYKLAPSTAVAFYQQVGGAHGWGSAAAGTAGNNISFQQYLTLSAAGHLTPGTDNSQTLGSGVARWSVVYAGTASINTSDARLKTSISPLSSAEIAAAVDLASEIGTFQYLAAVAQKGPDLARHHVGMTVQRAMEVMSGHGLDPLRYGFICLDQWAADAERGVAAGEVYGFRGEEFLLFVSRGLAQRQDALEARIAALEALA
ncbi:MAG: tail fiber domain-containing protein [Burkholderiaceae bacterium]|nr:tail fiber domain-containing protein [Burkholderiaceae bacterium]